MSAQKRGAQLITLERRRQISAENYFLDHDRMHTDGALLSAATEYMRVADFQRRNPGPVDPVEWLNIPGLHVTDVHAWPWDASDFKPTDPVRNLVKAGALIAAEIDRLLFQEGI